MGRELVRMGSLLKTHKFVTAVSHRFGEVVGFQDRSTGVVCALESPTEEKILHPNILVYLTDAS